MCVELDVKPQLDQSIIPDSFARTVADSVHAARRDGRRQFCRGDHADDDSAGAV